MEAKDAIALGAMLISLISAAASILFARKAATRSDEALRIQQETSERANDVLRLQLDALKRTDKNLELQYLGKIQDWSKGVIDAMADATALSEHDPVKYDTFFATRVEICARLSSLLDQGRMFFPNYDVPKGTEKPVAYRGIRQSILDPIKDAFDLARELDYVERGNNELTGRKITGERRKFVSEVQSVIGPRETSDFFKGLRENRGEERTDGQKA